MAFHLGNGVWNHVFAVPSAVTDVHLKIASGLSVKVLLLLLRHNGNIQPAELAASLGQSPADIQDALNYWIQCGVVSADDSPPAGVEAPAPAPQASIPAPAVPPEAPQSEAAGASDRQIVTVRSGRRRLTTEAINEMAAQDENITHLLQEAQAALGSTLTPVATETVVALYSYHEMQPDLILMLIHYCISIGKRSMHYIEKVAADWLERGIDTHEKAEGEILRLTKLNTAEGKVKAAFGIDRALVPSERNYIQKWTEEFGLGIDLIRLAYERAVEVKGKMSFAYINGILSNWHGKGIKTPAQAAQEIRPGTGKQAPAAQASKDRSYDMEELENMIAYGEIQ